jgi:protein TonB
MPFEAFLNHKQAGPGMRRRLTVASSLAVHGALGVAAMVHSFWHTDELSPPTVTVTFLAAAPPPPPPPPPAKKKTTQAKTVTREIVQPKPNEILQPKVKEQVKEDEGEEGGVVGGVAGGVLGGVVGGVVPVAVAPPPKEQAPRFLPPSVAGQQLLTDPVKDPQYRVALPPAFRQPGMRLWAMLKVCVSREGNVSDVRLIKGMDPAVDPLLLAKVQTWRYKPMSIDGRAITFCYNVRYEHASQ